MLAVDTNFVVKNLQLEESQDYVLLRQKGIEHIEKLARQIWTDYNVHDPGITIMELLCYAITDLGYRTGFDIKDLLTEEANGIQSIDETAFHTAAAIMPSSPVSFSDLRKILIDITGVKQAWVSINENVRYFYDERKKKLSYSRTSRHYRECGALNGLFDVLIQYEDFVTVAPLKVQLGEKVPVQPYASGVFILPQSGSKNRGLKFEVLKPVNIKSLSVLAETDGLVNLRLIDLANNTVIEEKSENVFAESAKLILLNWEINQNGLYVIDAGGTNIKLHRTASVNFPYEINPFIQLIEGDEGGVPKKNSYYFFYNWTVEHWPLPNGNSSIDSALDLIAPDVEQKVKDKLYFHRNLCEDFMNVRALKTEEISVCMDLEVRPDVDLEETLAEIYYQLELYVSPPVNFYTIQELLDKEKTTDQIFEGPLLEHGFIDHEEFIQLDRTNCLRTSDIIQIIMDVDGVTAVKSISLLSFVKIQEGDIRPSDTNETIHYTLDENEEEVIYRVQQKEWQLALQDVNFYAPDFSPEKSKVFFYKNSLPYLANRAVVDDLLAEKRAQQIRSKLRGHQQDLEVPIGNFRDLEDYYPIQNELPETYFTGQNLVPESRSNRRKAQSNQLKGYLLFFEQILANYLSQLANVKHLFSWEKQADGRSYFTQKLKEISEIEALYLEDYHTNLGATLSDIVESKELAGERKNKFLNHLIGRFSEQLTEYGLMMHSLLKKDANKRLITDKQALLQDYPRVSSERGKGFDYRLPRESDNLTGLQRRVYRLLGIYDPEDCSVKRQNFSSPSIRILDKIIADQNGQNKKCYFFRVLTERATTDVLEQEAQGVVIDDYSSYDYVFESNCCESRQQVCVMIDVLVSFGAKGIKEEHNEDCQKTNWCKIDNNPLGAGEAWVLKRSCISCDELLDWTNSADEVLINRAKEEILGFAHPSISLCEELKDMVIGHFATYAYREGFHVIENILLRKRTVESVDDFLPVEIHTPGEECECIEVKDPYSFRCTIIIPSWPERFRSTRFRQLVEKTLRLEAPAHVYLRICWINHCEMQTFEKCYDAWSLAHAELDCKFRGEIPLHYISPSTGEDETLTAEEKVILGEYSTKLKNLIDKIYTLNNVFTVARLHGCEDVDSDEPQVSLNNTSLGSV